MTLPETLRSRRAALQLTQDEVSTAVGVTRQTIGSLEQGRTIPSLLLARKLADFLVFSLDSLTAE